MKPTTKARRASLASLLAAATLVSTGCSTGGLSLASMNPFGSPATSGEPAGVTATLASTTTDAKGGIDSVGQSARNALGKTTSAIAGIFGRSADDAPEVANDPLSLSNKPEKVGPEVFVANGQLWESTGDFGKAMESYTKALESEPNDPPALTSIARLHFRQGNHKQAADFFRRAIAQNPNDAGLHNDLGLTLSKQGNHAAATASLSKALELAPGTSRYANNLASVHFESGNTAAAHQVLAKNNKPAVAHFNMAYLHFKNGQMSDARTHLQKALEFQPQAAGDAAVQRAVQRSRDMLAQIDASMAPVAQAAPQATLADGKAYPATPSTAAVQQASATPHGVAPAAPATSAITTPAAAVTATATPKTPQFPPSVTAPANESSRGLTISEPSASTTIAPASSKWGVSPVSNKSADRPMPVRPTAPAAEDSSGPTIPFALPSGFSPQ